MEADGKHIQHYSLDPSVDSFELASDSKLFVPEPDNKRILVIDLQTGSVKSFPFHFPKFNNYQMFKFRESGFICLYEKSGKHIIDIKG